MPQSRPDHVRRHAAGLKTVSAFEMQTILLECRFSASLSGFPGALGRRDAGGAVTPCPPLQGPRPCGPRPGGPAAAPSGHPGHQTPENWLTETILGDPPAVKCQVIPQVIHCKNDTVSTGQIMSFLVLRDVGSFLLPSFSSQGRTLSQSALCPSAWKDPGHTAAPRTGALKAP